jgi:uncharacterized membrane protein YkvA (DUF1232 family)
VGYLVGIAITLAVLWIVLLVALVLARPRGLRPAEAARLMPDVARLTTRLARDRTLSRRVRAPLWLLLVWVASPIDLVPDVLPVIGLVDDVVVAYVVLRHVVRRAGAPVVERHWSGTPEGLEALRRLLAVGG